MVRRLHNIKQLLNFRLKGLSRDISIMSGTGLQFVKSCRGGRILVYHGICRRSPLKFNTLFITRRTFELHLRLYKKYFNVVSLDDYYEQRFSSGRFNICLSFDDGFANNHKYVLPLLEQYQVPAAFFITGTRETGDDVLWNDLLAIAGKYGPHRLKLSNGEYIKRSDNSYYAPHTGELLADILRRCNYEEKQEAMEYLRPYKIKAPGEYWMQMTKDQIRELSASKWVTVGSHSCYHDDMGIMPAVAAGEDMKRSKQFLEGLTGKSIKAFAFPYGSYTSAAVREAKAAGFTQLLATEFISARDHDDNMMRERLTINPFITGINQLYASTTGRY